MNGPTLHWTCEATLLFLEAVLVNLCIRHNVLPAYISLFILSTVLDWFTIRSLLDVALIQNTWPNVRWCVAQCWADSILEAAPVVRKRGEFNRCPSKRKQCAGSQQNGQSAKKTSKQSQRNDKERQDPNQSGQDPKIPKPEAKPSKRQEADKTRPLACPFCKSNPDRYKECFKFNGSKLSYVKQHIYRNHEKPYCDICKETFNNGEARDAHASRRECEIVHGLEPGYITLGQKVELQRRPSGLDAENQWYRVFDIVCPGQPRPASPYNDFVITPMTTQKSPSSGVALPSEASEARNFLTSDAGMNIVLSHVQENQTWSHNDTGFREGIARGIDEALSIWATGYAFNNRSSSRDSSNDHRGTPSAGPIDDGPLDTVLSWSTDNGQPGASNWNMTVNQTLEHIPEVFEAHPIAPVAGQTAAEETLFGIFVEQQHSHPSATNVSSQTWTANSATLVDGLDIEELSTDILSGIIRSEPDSFPDPDFDEQWPWDLGQL